jgi:signal transduction histidine kinase
MGYLISTIILVCAIYLFWYYWISLLIFLKVRLEGRTKDLHLISSLREEFIHEGKKKFAGLGQILDSLKRGEKLKSHLDYFQKLLTQLKSLLDSQRENLLLVSEDIFIYAKLRNGLIGIEKRAKRLREKDIQHNSNIEKIRLNLKSIQEDLETTLNKATERFSFSINEVVKESVKTVRIEKSDILQKEQITIEESYPEDTGGIRLPYYALRDWHKLLGNLVRNAVESIELRVKSKEKRWVRISFDKMEKDSVSITIEDSGKGMDEKIKNEFFKRGFTKKNNGLGLGITEESINLVNSYGSWEIESEIGKGTKIQIKIEKDKVQAHRIEIEGKRTILQRAFPTPARVVLTALLLSIIGLVILFSVDKYSRFWVDWNPAFWEHQENHLRVMNKSRDFLWEVILPAKIATSLNVSDKYVIKIEDLNADGRTEVCVGIDFTERSTGKIICFSFKGEKLWEFLCGKSGVYKEESRYFYPAHIMFEDLFGDNKKEILVNSAHSVYFPDQIAILDSEGKQLSEYWHPGIFGFMDCLDIDNNGEMEIILGGINNRMDWSPVVCVLDPKRASGKAMPYRASNDIIKAKEKCYVIFPHVKKILPEDYKWKDFLSGISNIQVFTTEDEIRINLQDTRNYFLSLNFEFIKYYFNLSYYLSWKERINFLFELTDHDTTNWKNIKVWKDGIRIR